MPGAGVSCDRPLAGIYIQRFVIKTVGACCVQVYDTYPALGGVLILFELPGLAPHSFVGLCRMFINFAAKKAVRLEMTANDGDE
jgi:hypothetical protein